MTEFKVGDKAKCLDASFAWDLAEGEIYTISCVGTLYGKAAVGLSEHGDKESSSYASRFEKVEDAPEEFPYMFEVGEWVVTEQPKEGSVLKKGDMYRVATTEDEDNTQFLTLKGITQYHLYYSSRFRKATQEEVAAHLGKEQGPTLGEFNEDGFTLKYLTVSGGSDVGDGVMVDTGEHNKPMEDRDNDQGKAKEFEDVLRRRTQDKKDNWVRETLPTESEQIADAISKTLSVAQHPQAMWR